jgi:hypothetical protein
LPVRVWLLVDVLSMREAAITRTKLVADGRAATAWSAVVQLGLGALVMVIGLLSSVYAPDADPFVAARKDTWMIPTIATRHRH